MWQWSLAILCTIIMKWLLSQWMMQGSEMRVKRSGGGFDGHAAQADLPGSVADVEKGNALAGDAAKVAEVLQGVVFPVIFGDDFEACGTAVLGIHLKFIRKTL